MSVKKYKQEKLSMFLEAIETDKEMEDGEEDMDGMDESTFSRKHYQQIASIFKQHLDGPRNEKVYNELAAIANELADLFEEDNPRFDREKFLQACNVGSETTEEEDGEEDEDGDEEKELETEDEDTEDDEEGDMEEATAQLGTIEQILQALSSDPISGVADLLNLAGSKIVEVLNLTGGDKQKVQTALEKMRQDAEKRKSALKNQKSKIQKMAAGDDEEMEGDEEEIEETEEVVKKN